MIEHLNEVVFLPALAVTGPVIDGRRFENCRIVGPAMLALLEQVTVQGCDLGGSVEQILVEVAPDRQVVGAIGLRRCEFTRCTFEGIGWIGTVPVLDLLRVGAMRL